MNDLARYWYTPWLRLHNIERLRAAHVARWAFKVGDVVTREWCSPCGLSDHYGIILRLTRGHAGTRALVRFTCRVGETEIGTLFLRRALPPYPKEVLTLQHVRRWSDNNEGVKENVVKRVPA